MEGIARFWAKIQGVKKFVKCKFQGLSMLEMHTLLYIIYHIDWRGGDPTLMEMQCCTPKRSAISSALECYF